MQKKTSDKNEELIKILIENSVNLQKVMTNNAVKLDLLADNMAKLLHLFEISARSFADKQGIPDVEKDREFLNKLNMLIDQNKTIAKGLTLMEEKIRERVYGGEEAPRANPIIMQQKPLQSQPDLRPEFKRLPKF